MGTIEEKAERYEHWADQINNRWDKPEEHIPFKEQIKRAFIAGAKAQHAALTRWHDPKEELPEYYKAVEIKHCGLGQTTISTAWLSAGDDGGYLWTIDGTNVVVGVKNVIGWREIQE